MRSSIAVFDITARSGYLLPSTVLHSWKGSHLLSRRMLRYLLVLLTVTIVVLAVLFDHLWLRVGAGGAIVAALGLLGWRFWRGSREDEETSRPRPEPKGDNESLEELGIVDIRPEDEGNAEPEASSQPSSGESPAETASPSFLSDASETSPAASPNETNRTTETPASRQPVTTEEAPVLAPFLQSLRAALGAQTVCLLVQEEVALTYRIEAIASTATAAGVQRSGSFDTQTPLLTASMSRQSVSVRSLTDAEVAIEDLGYYENPPEVNQLATAPVPQPDDSSTRFLLADATAPTDLGRSRARTLLEHFAETVVLVSAGEEASADEQGAAQAEEESRSPAAEAAGAREDAPRPRREIIAEEMEAAAAASDDLALVLVHLNRAESIARRGKEAVDSAERLLQARLEQISPTHRVERFGELTYGIFFRGSPDAVQSWVADLEAEMAQEEGELEGGVSVGVAVWSEPDEDPEALRAAATEALHEAYKTGTSTIVT